MAAAYPDHYLQILHVLQTTLSADEAKALVADMSALSARCQQIRELLTTVDAEADSNSVFQITEEMQVDA